MPAMTLITCPKSVTQVWPDQIARFAPDSGIVVCAPVKGTVARRVEEARAGVVSAKDKGKPFVLVLNHESAWRTEDALLKCKWDLMVNDESHRSSSSPRSRFYRWAWRVKADKRVCLSGTPMSHSPLNIWPQGRFLGMDVPATMTQFKARYAVMGGHRVNGRPVQVLGFQNLDELERRIATLIDRVKKSDVLDLPPVVHEDIAVELPPAAMRVYQAMEDEMIAHVNGGTVTAANVLSKGIRLRQITQGAVKNEEGGIEPVHTAKADALAELLDDLDPSEPVVVFCVFHSDLDAVARVSREAGRPCNELSGRMNDVGAEWKPQPGAVAAIQIQSGGVGISLVASAYAVYYGPSWSLSDYDQSLARLDRPGQTRSVTYLHLVAAGTIDMTIRRALVARRNLVESIMGHFSR